ncbi:DUF4364 family protein, partial [Tyzzerella sp. OttesenSCG-928-J15]|nr:DUF4364 family protein [Tyzzerella sp. OttesenSCG-928-J15]
MGLSNSFGDVSDYAQVENKLILLYLIEKMDIPISTSQISQFVLGESMIGYFDLQQCLSEMVDDNYVEATQENNNTRYSITDTGLTTLDYFEKRIPVYIRNKINKHVLENRKYIKRDYETTANYFKDIHTGDYTVKCGIYEDDAMLMEINLTVVSREHARGICENWRNNVTQLYGNILGNLVNKGK